METLLGATLSGVFWATDIPASKLSGSLHIDENGSATLTVQGDGLTRSDSHGGSSTKPLAASACKRAVEQHKFSALGNIGGNRRLDAKFFS
jgi:hypothetical protein